MRYPSPRTPRLAAGLIALAFAFALPRPASASPPPQADDDRDRAILGRFVAVLERDPRRGTALDRVYGYHVERGSLDGLIQTYRDRAAKDPLDGASRLIVGLLESQRGRDSSAVAALREAERVRPDDPLPSYYLGQALVLIGQPTQAAEAFERAIARKPSRADLLDIFQALGRVYQRGRRDDRAAATWARLEALFPDDPKVKEQVAASLAEDAQYAPALARYEALAKSSRDPYRKIQYRTEAADLEVKLGRQADALRDYEGLLGSLDPESWVAREVRRKIEEVFLRNEDQGGLAAYYEGWIARSPEDVEAMARLARSLANQGRSAEARTWLEKALKLAPSRKALRLALIEQFAQEKKFAEAAAQYEILARADPNNPDLVRDRGRMLLRDTSRPEAERKRAAAAVWQKLVDARADDPSTAAQVAELLRQAGMVDEALALYEKAVRLAPDSPQYREYLGEYQHSLKRDADALATWRGMAAPPRRDAATLRRLGEVLAGFGHKPEAADAIAEATRLDPDAFDLRLRLAGLLQDLRRFDDADAQLDQAARLASDDDARTEVLDRRVALDEAAARIPARLASTRLEVAGPGAVDPAAWRKLARYAEAARQPIEAVGAAEKAVGLDPRSVPSLVALARLYESTGRFLDSADTSRKLAAVDRRARAEHLTNVAKLEARLGRREPALEAGRELLAASPGNAENLQFFADLCFQLADTDQGIDVLRRATRSGEADPRPMIALAEALARDFRTEEAIEQYWRAFDRTVDLDGKLGLINRLADLHLQRNQVDRLLGRLERIGREEGKSREGALYLAQALSAIGDPATARAQLEGLLAANSRDTGLFKQLSKLAEEEGDLSAALKYQQQLYEVAPGDDASYRLTQLALRSGDFDVAEALWSKSAESGQDLSRTLLALDALLSHGKAEAVLATTTRLLLKDPSNWEALYREARALTALDRPAEAARRYADLLAIRRPDDDLSAIVKARRKAPPAGMTAAASSPATAAATLMERVGLRYRAAVATTIRGVFNLETGPVSTLASTWVPMEFAQARMAALAGLLVQARRDKDEAGWLVRRREAREHAPGDTRLLWDDYYVSVLRSELRETYELARDLVRASGRDPAADYALIMALYYRNTPPGTPARQIALESPQDTSPPLPGDEIDLIRDAYLSIVRTSPALIFSAVQETVSNELKKAGRLGEIEPTYRELVANVRDIDTYSSVAMMAADRGDLDALRTLSAAYYRFPASLRGTPIPSQPYYSRTSQGIIPSPAYFLSRALIGKADAKEYGEILRVLDDEMTSLRTPARVAERARAARTSAPSPIPARYYVYTSTRTGTLTSFDFPTAGPYLDHSALQLLRNVFALFQRDDLLGDLKAHLKGSVESSGGDASAGLSARMAYASVLWWAGERDEALGELNRAVALAPADAELKLTLAELRARRSEPDEALALLDAIEAPDQDLARRRELLALRVAIQGNRTDRAVQAAERLFGLRLDSPTQLQLASQMQQLGMVDLAEAVLARARRRSGGDTDALVTLMGQYQRMGNAETAAQIAMQVLRKAPGGALGAPRSADIEDPAHRQAIQVLAGSGKLAEMIERAEAQRKLSPQSVPILQALATYYRAAGRNDRLKEVSEAMIRIRPDDARLRLQLATQLVASGDTPAALDQYRAVLKKDPALFSYNAPDIAAAFIRAKKTDEFLRLIDEVGITSTGTYMGLAPLLQTLMNDPKTIDQGMGLLRRIWDAFPADRLQTLYYGFLNQNEAFWKRPESATYAKEAILSGPLSRNSSVLTWMGIDTIFAQTLDGDRIATPATRLLDASGRAGTLDALAAEFEAAAAKSPRWLTGKAIVGMIRARQGRPDEARSILEPLLAQRAATSEYYEPLVIIAQELKGNPATAPLAVAYYERATKGPAAWAYLMINIPGNAFRQLALLYRQLGRAADARPLIARAVEYLVGMGNGPGSDLTSYRKLSGLAAFADLSLEIGDPAAALRTDNLVLSAGDEIRAASSFIAGVRTTSSVTLRSPDTYPTVDTLLDQSRARVDRVLNHLDPAAVAPTLRSLVAPGGNRPPDLMLVVHPREVDRAEVASLFGSALDRAAADPGLLAPVRADLDSASKARPGDLEVEVAAALAGLAGPMPPSVEVVARVAEGVERLAASTPLEPLGAGAKANAPQRAEAARRLGLWLVARACWAHESTRAVGDRLADAALEAARRQLDGAWALAMLRERGLRDLDRGDRPSAEARWADLLDRILATAAVAPSPTPAPPPLPRGQSMGVRARTPVLTLERFEQAAGLARLAADHGAYDLSARAVRESLKGGPPVVPVAINATPAIPRASSGIEPPPDPVAAKVEAALVGVDALWDRLKFDPGLAYEAFRDVVLPPTRPLEIFLFDGATGRTARPSAAPSTPPKVAAVARLLARRAVLAGRADDLRKRVADRQAQPPAKAAAAALLEQLDAAEKAPR